MNKWYLLKVFPHSSFLLPHSSNMILQLFAFKIVKKIVWAFVCQISAISLLLLFLLISLWVHVCRFHYFKNILNELWYTTISMMIYKWIFNNILSLLSNQTLRDFRKFCINHKSSKVVMGCKFVWINDSELLWN